MTRPAAFTQGDVAKVLKGARAAGMDVRRIEIDREGKIVALFGRPGAGDAVPANEWDEVYGQEQQPAPQRHRVPGRPR